MTQDATSEPSETTDTTSATEDDDTQAQQMLAEAAAQADDDANGDIDESAGPQDHQKKQGQGKDGKPAEEDKLGDSGKRALVSERKARREAERRLNDIQAQLQQYQDRDKTEQQKAIERAEAAERQAAEMRVANARLMAAATYDLDPDLIDLLGDGTDEEIDERAKRLAEFRDKHKPGSGDGGEPKGPPAAKPAPARRPVESLTPGAKPANAEPEDPDAWLRRMAGRRT